MLLEQLAHQPQRRPSVAAALGQHVENLALVIDGTPQIHSLARDAHHHLVQPDRGEDFIIDMIVAISTVQLATIPKALSFIDRLDDFLYLPEVMYIIIFLWLISSGQRRFSVDHWIAVRSGLLDGR